MSAPFLLTPQQALAFGWSVLPLNGRREALVKWLVYQRRLPTSEELLAWQTLNPACWGFITGTLSGRVTLDFDGPGGRHTYGRLAKYVQAQHGILLVPHRQTPSGGLHIDFAHPGPSWRVTTCNHKAKRALAANWSDLDVRGDGGYAGFFGAAEIKGATPHPVTGALPTGQYTWLRDPELYSLDILPPDLREAFGLLHPPTEKAPAANTQARAPTDAADASRVPAAVLIGRAVEQMRVEGRNNAGFWLATQCRDNRYSQSETADILRDYAGACPNVNMKGHREPYAARDREATLKQVFQRPAREPWTPAQAQEETPTTSRNDTVGPQNYPAASSQSTVPVNGREQASTDENIDDVPIPDAYEESATYPPGTFEPSSHGKEKTKEKRKKKRESTGGWRNRLTCNSKGEAHSNLWNVHLCLSCDIRWEGALRFDEFSFRVIVTDSAPKGIDRGELQDHILDRIHCWLEADFLPRISTENVQKAVHLVARANSFHPIRDYFDRLQWDGQPRLATFFAVYFQAKGPTVYLREVACMFFVAAVARIYRPGCQADYMLVLEGKQGIFKSQALRALFGAEYFTDQMPSLDGRDASIQLRGKHCIEFAEFDRLSKHEASTVKAFVTRPVDTYRPINGRETVNVPRQCVFAATVNPTEYLTDEENRRFWPVRCGQIDVVAILRDRDQLWAEAVVLYRKGSSWWPSAELLPEFQEQQEKREIENPYHARLAEWLDQTAISGRITETPQWLTTAHILDGLQIPPAQWKSVEQYVAKAMRKLGYIKKRYGSQSLRFWNKP
jgi:predicted P-loop ATPase